VHYQTRKKLRAQAIRSNFKYIDERAIDVKIHYTHEITNKNYKKISILRNKIDHALKDNIKRLLLNVVRQTRIFNFSLKVSCSYVYGDISLNFFLKGKNVNIGKLYFFGDNNDEPVQLMIPQKYLYKLSNHLYSIEANDVTLKHCNDALKIMQIDNFEMEDYSELVNKEMKMFISYNTKIRDLFISLSEKGLYDIKSAFKSGYETEFNSKYYIEVQYLISDKILWFIEANGFNSEIRDIKDFNFSNLIMSLHDCDFIFKQKEIKEHLLDFNFDELCDMTKLLNY